MKKALIAIALIACCGVAQAADTKFQVGLGLVNSMPMSTDFKDAAKSALGFNISGDYLVSEQFAAGLEIGSLSYDSKGALKAYGIKSLDTMSYGVRAKYMKPMDFGSKKGKLYGLLGLASYSWSTDPKTSTSSEIGFSLGAGAEVEIAPQWLVGFELRYHMVKDDSMDSNTLDPMLNLGYAF